MIRMIGTMKKPSLKPPSITEEPQPELSKEVVERYTFLRREYEVATYRTSNVGKRPPKSLLDAEEVARSNLRAFERLHGLTSSDHRIW